MDGLRVAGASMTPAAVSAGTDAAPTMVAERAAAMALAERRAA